MVSRKNHKIKGFHRFAKKGLRQQDATPTCQPHLSAPGRDADIAGECAWAKRTTQDCPHSTLMLSQIRVRFEALCKSIVPTGDSEQRGNMSNKHQELRERKGYTRREARKSMTVKTCASVSTTAFPSKPLPTPGPSADVGLHFHPPAINVSAYPSRVGLHGKPNRIN